MNVSPHHQRPTKYPWPGPASGVWVLLAIAVLLLIAFMVLVGSPPAENEEPTPTGTRIIAPQRL